MKLCKIFVCLLFFGVGICRINNQRRHRQLSSTTLEYFTKPNRDITIPIKIHFDQVLTKKLSTEYKLRTRHKLKLLTSNIVKDVENIFRHSTLNQKIRLKLLDTRFLKNNTNVVTMDENATRYLKSYCEWQGRKKMHKGYYSVLLTGLDIYVNDGGKFGRSSTGRGYMNGMCNPTKSCTLLEWHPNNIAYLLTHEIAHSLGVTHDGHPHNQCKPQNYMMAARYNPKRPPKSWSSCSRKALKRYLISKKAWCLSSKNQNGKPRRY